MERLVQRGILATIDDRVDIHVRGRGRGKIRPRAGQNVDHPGRQIAGGQNLGKGQSRQWRGLRGKQNTGIASDNRRRHKVNERSKGRLVRTNNDHHAGCLGISEIEMRG